MSDRTLEDAINNAKRIKEGSIVFYKGLACTVVESFTMYVDLKVNGSSEMFQGVHVSNFN